ncbi:Lectin C-type domain protein [Stieleria neptunia]|uniref:Probable pectate lyase C n=1 Tax=Stieleria neptunia TaxID=2527979 RepID=A0A518I1S9_9BACT|nr:choice-of-anchor D domain-containing protein [Stieleria neptunia]QDV47069.1 Lectin C-type domain protein [Stieleria neptunia]
MARRSPAQLRKPSKRSRFRSLFCDPLEPRLLLAANLHNEALPADVDGNGAVTPSDAAAVIEYLSGSTETKEIVAHFDVSGDGSVTPRDGLLVVNYLANSDPESDGGTFGAAAASAGPDRPAVVVPNGPSADWWFDLDSDPDVEADQSYGLSNDFGADSVFLAADWNGDGEDDLVVVRKDYAAGKWQWFVNTNEDPFYFGLLENPSTGQPADIPVAGDWDGAGGANAGVARPNGEFLDWYITTDDNETAEIGPVLFGLSGDIPVTGDWGVRDPVTGDWEGDGRDKIGTARRGSGLLQWYLDIDGNGGFEAATEGPFEFGLSDPTDTPVVGDWDNDGADDLGVARNVPVANRIDWYRNTDRNDPFAHLPVYQYGLTSHTTVVAGRWGSKPEISVTESGHEIGTGQRVNLAESGLDPTSTTLWINNTGNHPLTVTPGLVPAGFLIADFPPSPIEPGQSAPFTVELDVAVVGYQSGDFTISTNDENESQFLLRLNESAPRISLPEVVADMYPFGTFTVGQSLSHTFEVHNDGRADLVISNPLIEGDFDLQPDAFPTTVKPRGKYKTFTITADTSSPGPRTGTLTFETNDPDANPFVIEFSADVEVPKPDIEASVANGEAFPFGTVTPLSETLLTRVIRIDNVGNAPLVLNSFTLPGNVFSMDGSLFPITIQPKAHTNLSPAFHVDQAVEGLNTSLLTLDINDASENPYVIRLEGTYHSNPASGAMLVVDRASNGGAYPFPDGQESQPSRVPFTISNSGDAPLTLTAASTATADFSIPASGNPGFPLSIPPGDSEVIFVGMDTSSSGPKSGQLRLHHDATPGVYTINLSGNVSSAPVFVKSTHLFSFEKSGVRLVNTTADRSIINPDRSDIVQLTEFSNGEYSFEIVFTAQSLGLTDVNETIDAFAYPYPGGLLYLSTEGRATAGNAQSGEITFGPGDIVSYDPGRGRWSNVFDAASVSLDGNIDGIDYVGSSQFVVSLEQDGQLALGGQNQSVSRNDLLTLYVQTGEFSKRHSASDITTSLANVDAVSSTVGKPIVSLDKFGVGFVDGSTTAEPQDTVRLSEGRWEMFLDGTDFGIEGGNANVSGYQAVSQVGRSSAVYGDYSDAPPRYPQTSHATVPGAPYFGATVDEEPGAQPEANADGDDRDIFFLGESFQGGAENGLMIPALPAGHVMEMGGPVGAAPDAEDGFTIPKLVAGQTMEMGVHVGGAPGVVDGWIDFNGDGDWDDDGEHILDALSLPVGISTVSFVVPSDARPRDTFARFRIAETAVPDAATDVVGGEVEDYKVSFEQTDFLVTHTSDSGAGSLRQAILDANAASGPATIRFEIPDTDEGLVDVDSLLPGGDATPDVFRIAPESALPTLNNASGHPVFIDGSTQQTFGGDTNAFGPEIEISGLSAGGGSHGVVIESDFATLHALVVNDFGNTGVVIRGDHAILTGSFVGTDAIGATAKPNRGTAGVFIDGAEDVIVGGHSIADRNVISGNTRDGIAVDLSRRVDVSGNYIGTTADGMQPLANDEKGIEIGRSHQVRVGGDRRIGSGNVISGNTRHGISVTLGSSEIDISGNFVGVDSQGYNPLGNGERGVSISNSVDVAVGGNKLEGLGNVISANGSHGVIADAGSSLITISGNLIGTDSTGVIDLGNSGRGITVTDVSEVLIGGPIPAHGNVISGNVTNAIGNNFGQLIQDITITSNIIGLNAAGNAAIPNGSPTGDSQGIRIRNAFNVTIGAPGAGNVISGNAGSFARGIGMSQTTNLTIQANRIGTDASGTAMIGNTRDGIHIDSSSVVLIGGAAEGEGNLISGNDRDGVLIEDSIGVDLLGNKIGTDITGMLDFGNGEDGISVYGTTNLRIGGNLGAASNVVSGNDRTGIDLSGYGHNDDFNSGITIAGNLIGTTADGNSPLANRREGLLISRTYRAIVEQNVISGNGVEPSGVPNSAPGVSIQDARLDTTVFQWPVSEGGNDHYYLIAPPMLWADAESTATAVGGHLASVTSQDEADFIQAAFRSTDAFHRSEDLYIGLNDRDVESVFQWTTNEPFDPVGFAPWRSNEPHANGNNDDAVLLKTDGTWDNVRDDSVMFSLFEFEFEPIFSPGTATLQDSEIRLMDNTIGLGLDRLTPLGNGGFGAFIRRSETVWVQGNFVADNGGAGIEFDDTSVAIVGGPLSDARNQIFGNAADGLSITGSSEGVFVGPNSIFNNGGLGIDLGNDGPTPNDPDDVDAGPNGLQNTPTIQRVAISETNTVIFGTLQSDPDTTFSIELFANDVAAAEEAEGEIYLGTAYASTGPTGLGTFQMTVPDVVAPDLYLTATAEHQLRGTSEFSPGVQLSQLVVPTVESIAINRGSASRSQVTSLEVMFDDEVDHAALATAFSLENLSTQTQVTSLVVTAAVNADGKTSVALTFGAGPSVDGRLGEGSLGNSLADGHYKLTIAAASVQSASGGPGMVDDHVFGAEEADGFFRLYGDTDGDRDVDGQDYGRFGLAFLKSSGQSGFDPDLDRDGDGDVDGQDYGSFGIRFLKKLTFP